VPRQLLTPEQNHRWAEVEGTVDFAYEQDGALYLELNSDYGPMNVEIADETDGSSLLLLGSRVKVQGFCQSGLISDGQSIAANLYTPGMKQVELLKIPVAQWSRYPLESIGVATAKITSLSGEIIIHVRGTATVGTSGHSLKLADTTGRVELETSQPLPAHFTGEVEAIGRLIRSETNVVVRGGIYRQVTGQPEENSPALPLLTTVLQVKQLTRERAQQGYPVKIRGVVTLVRGGGSGFIIQDDTAAIDVWWPVHSNTSRPRVGDYWEIEGKTFAEFAPNITATRTERLGTGAMPAPLHPTLDQLLNGSLDTRYVELQGFVTEINPGENAITLFTHGGKIRVTLPLETFSMDTLKHYQNALVRIRGCVVPVRNEASRQVQVGVIRLSNPSLTVDEPPPENPFELERKRVPELLLFDVQAGSLQRVKVAGQVLHQRGSEFFLLDETNAMRILAKNVSHDFQVGDWVEAVGFPELSGSLPVLHEAVLRRLMVASLPEPLRLSADSPFNKKYDGRLVSLAARLIDTGGNWQEKTLRLQAGNREFVARLDNAADALPDLRPGSLLKLTGVYADLGGGTATGQGVTSFELLLNSHADITVLERPPWWTLRRALMVAGSLLAVIFGGALWIFLLRQQVQEQVAQLAQEVRQREQAQQQNLLEKERARIAKDMHDQLGMSVTRVGLLGELTRQNAGDSNKTAAHAKKICETAFELGRTLDEIVWAVNPKNDSLVKFCDYIAVQAQELFQLTQTLCRVDLPPEMPDLLLSAEIRHNLFLVVKEALNNVVRHASAGEVWVRFKLETSFFQISIQDNGRGFVADSRSALRNGLSNMKKRLEEVGGDFAVSSQPGKGTEVKLTIDLNRIAQMSRAEFILPP
ncbi:MAG TPA: ATP-binding protein, partial [Verrucomicrobiae bacterium]